MNARHKHADLIHAWAEGQKIQALSNDSWMDCDNPTWSPYRCYRVKPKPITLKYRRYVTRDTSDKKPGVFCWQYDMKDKYDPMVIPGFIRWIDFNWQEVDIQE